MGGAAAPAHPGTPDDAAKLRDDYRDAYAKAFAAVRDPDDARRLAASWLRWKWGRTDVGSEPNRLMPFPPDRDVAAPGKSLPKGSAGAVHASISTVI